MHSILSVHPNLLTFCERKKKVFSHLRVKLLFSARVTILATVSTVTLGWLTPLITMFHIRAWGWPMASFTGVRIRVTQTLKMQQTLAFFFFLIIRTEQHLTYIWTFVDFFFDLYCCGNGGKRTPVCIVLEAWYTALFCSWPVRNWCLWGINGR